MIFFIGFISGFIVSVIIEITALLLLIYFKQPIEKTIIETKNRFITKTQKGKIIEPETEIEEEQNEIIKRNRELGQETYLSDITPTK